MNRVMGGEDCNEAVARHSNVEPTVRKRRHVSQVKTSLDIGMSSYDRPATITPVPNDWKRRNESAFRRWIISKLSAAAPAKPRRSRPREVPEASARAATQAESRNLAIAVARTLADERCHQISVLDVSGISPVTDYFVVATGTSGRQMKTAADKADELSKNSGATRLSRSGDDSANWIILDLFDVIVHVFTQEARSYYDVDGLWGDARRIEWERPEIDTPKARAE